MTLPARSSVVARAAPRRAVAGRPGTGAPRAPPGRGAPATQLISLPSPTRHSRGSTGRGHTPEVLMTPIRHLRTMSVVVVALGLASCGGSSTAPKAPPAALTGLPRELTAVETSVRDAANAFSFALWRRVNQVQRDQNVFI